MNPKIIPGTIETYYRTTVKNDVATLLKDLGTLFPTTDVRIGPDSSDGMVVAITCYVIDNTRKIIEMIDGYKGPEGTTFYLPQEKDRDDGRHDPERP